MKTRVLFLVTAIALLCSLANADVTVYRAVDNKNATYAKVADSQWRADSDGVSTFELANFSASSKLCQVTFVIVGVNSQPAQGTTGQVQNMPTGYVGEYTPQYGGAGHWSIHGPPGTPNATLQSAITAYVLAQKVAGKNPTYTGSSKSQCLTPTTANLTLTTATGKENSSGR